MALTIQKYDPEKRKLDKVVEGVNAFEVSANGEKMLYRQQQNWFIASTTQPVKPGEGKLKTEQSNLKQNLFNELAPATPKMTAKQKVEYLTSRLGDFVGTTFSCSI